MASLITSLCYSACGTAWATCYATAGLIAGTVAAPFAPSAALACNLVESACMKSCFVAQIAPILNPATEVITGLAAVCTTFVVAWSVMKKKHNSKNNGKLTDAEKDDEPPKSRL